MIAASDISFCPVRAMRTVLLETPTVLTSDPLFMFPHTRKPVPTTFLAQVLKDHLIKMGLPSLTKSISLHSLRKAAATDAFAGGCPELTIKQYGTWSSSAYTPYINTNNASINTALVATLQQF